MTQPGHFLDGEDHGRHGGDVVKNCQLDVPLITMCEKWRGVHFALNYALITSHYYYYFAWRASSTHSGELRTY